MGRSGDSWLLSSPSFEHRPTPPPSGGMGLLDLDHSTSWSAGGGVLEGEFRPAGGEGGGLPLPPGVFRRPDLALAPAVFHPRETRQVAAPLAGTGAEQDAERNQAEQGLLAEQEHRGHWWLGQGDVMEREQGAGSEESGRGV